MKPQALQRDILVRTDGDRVLFVGLTSAGREWLHGALPLACPRLGLAYAVEARYAPDIIERMMRDGLLLRY